MHERRPPITKKKPTDVHEKVAERRPTVTASSRASPHHNFRVALYEPQAFSNDEGCRQSTRTDIPRELAPFEDSSGAPSSLTLRGYRHIVSMDPGLVLRVERVTWVSTPREVDRHGSTGKVSARADGRTTETAIHGDPIREPVWTVRSSTSLGSSALAPVARMASRCCCRW